MLKSKMWRGCTRILGTTGCSSSTTKGFSSRPSMRSYPTANWVAMPLKNTSPYLFLNDRTFHKIS